LAIQLRMEVSELSDKKGDDGEMINKNKGEQVPQVATVSNEQAMKAALEQFNTYRDTFKKLAKN
jgi:hypothetical protein